MTAPAAGIGSALAWGAGDFVAGVASRRASVLVVAGGSQLVGLVILPILALALGEPIPAARDWLWAGAAGVSAFAGIGGLYAALASGRMGVAAPLTGVLAASLPVAYAWTVAGTPGELAVAGMVLALAGIALAGGPRAERPPARVLGLSILSGVGFAGFLLLMGESSRDAFVWTLIAARLGTLGSILVAIAITRPALRGAPVGAVALAGLLIVIGDALYLGAARLGRLDVAVVLSSLYPVGTVALARIVLKERLTRTQAWGAALMLAAIPLIAWGT